MTKRVCLSIVLLALLLWAPAALAQCNNAQIVGCQPAVDPQPTDILLGYQLGQNPHVRKFTLQQLANTTAGTFTTLNISGDATIGGALTSGPSTLSTLTVPGAVSFTSNLPVAFNVSSGAVIGGSLSAGTTNLVSLGVSGSASLSSLTVTGNSTVGGTFGVTGIATFSAPYRTQNVTTTTLPPNPGPGGHVWATDCRNGSEGAGSGTGCDYHTNSAGTWVGNPTPPTGTITIGGATPVFLGGTIPGQGNGSTVQMSAAVSPVSGHVPQYDATGNLVDSGSGPGGGGGSGSVASGLANQIGVYAAAGTNISGLTIVNNGVPSYNGSGLLSVSTVLPGSLTIPSPSISNPNVTGTLSAIAVNLSGKLTLAASATGGTGLAMTVGVAPTAPNNGDIWTTSTGLFVRANGATVGPLIGLAQQSALAPLVYNSGTGQESCPTCALTINGGQLAATVPVAISATGLITCLTCATTTNGGGLSAIAPMSISAAGSIALGQLQRYALLLWDDQTAVHNFTYPVVVKAPTGGTIQSVVTYTNGTNSPAFRVGLTVNGVSVVNCTTIVVGTGGSGVGNKATTPCTPTTFVSQDEVDVVISSTVGSPSNAGIQVNYTMAPI